MSITEDVPATSSANQAGLRIDVPGLRRRRGDEPHLASDADHGTHEPASVDAPQPSESASETASMTDAGGAPEASPDVASTTDPAATGDAAAAPRDERYSALLAAGLGLLGVGGAATAVSSGSSAKPPVVIDPPTPQTPTGEDKPKPGADTPKPETPKPETPAPETPKPETPKPETPSGEKPSGEKPDPQNPDPQNPGSQTPNPQTPDPQNPDPQKPDPGKPQEPGPQEPEPQVPGGGDSGGPGPAPADTTPPAALTLVPPSNGWLGIQGEIRITGLEPGAAWYFSLDGLRWHAGTGAGLRGSDVGQEGDQKIWVRQIDEAGNVGESSHVEVKVDLTPPIEAVIRFPSDPLLAGPFHTEPHIKSSDIYISANPGWFYSWDGQTWQQGAGDRIAQSLLPGQGKQSLFIREEDQAGNITISRRNFTIDDHAPVAPTLQLVNDTGARDDDRVTFDGTLRITNLEPEAKWWMKAYFNGKEVYAGGTTDTISTGEMGIAAGATGSVVVFVQQIDAAGHQSGMTRFGFDLYAQHAVI